MGSHKIDLNTAVGEIRAAYEDTDMARLPFFFIIGAGVSYPSVPLASQITDECRKKAEDRHVAYPPDTELGPLERYSIWFDRAYPHPIDRQKYLRSLIEKKPVTDANLRLAHILASRKISNLVVTSNFDDLLPRSLTIFGVPHVVSDHPGVVDRIDLDGDDLQIVHVHGSYRFYDCRNLRDELVSRALPSALSTNTMAAFLDRVLSFRSPIVIGYAGWESDVIMAALHRRLVGNTLPYRLYWCAYSQESVASLPRWLVDHNDVRIVLPQDVDKFGARGSIPADSDTADSLFSLDARTLPAQAVLEALSRAFELSEPELTKDPVAFFARQLRESTRRDGDQQDAVYFLRDIVNRVERAAELERSDRKRFSQDNTPSSISERKLADIKDLVRRSRYSDAVSAATAVSLQDLNEKERVELFEILGQSLSVETQNQKNAMKGFELLQALGEKLYQSDDPESIRKFVIIPLLEKGSLLYRAKRQDEAIACYEEITRRFSSDERSVIQEWVTYAQTRKVLSLSEASRFDEAVALSDTLLPKISKMDRSWTRWLLPQTLFNRAIYLHKANRIRDALAAYDEFISQFDRAPDVFTQVLVAGALIAKASIYRRTGRKGQALAAYDRVLELYRDATHEQVTAQVRAARKLKDEMKKRKVAKIATDKNGNN